MILKKIPGVLAVLIVLACAETPPSVENEGPPRSALVHAHNDYRREPPFVLAHTSGAASIEADIFLRDNELKVAHSSLELKSAPALLDAYILPLAEIFEKNGGRAWKNSSQILCLLVDIKSEARPALDKLVQILSKYPQVFDPSVNPLAVRVVISGNRPPPEEFSQYPSFILFDGAALDYSPAELEKIFMISFRWNRYSSWKGRGRMSEKDRRRLAGTIEAVHALGKPLRFWASPDNPAAWRLLAEMGIDYINTDHPAECTAFFGISGD
jgi:alkaline phosphatase